MASTLGSIGAPSQGVAALVTTAGGADGAPPVVLAAFQDADTLMLAVTRAPLAGAGAAGVGARRPARPLPAAGWAQPLVQTLLPKSTGAAASSAAKKTATAAGSSKSAPSPAKATSSSSTKKSTDPLSFLSDSKLSVEEKLMRFLAWVSDKNEKELIKKMDEIHAKQTKKSSSGGKGLLGSIAGGAGKLLGGVVGKVALAAIPGVGPFLAAGGIGLDVLKSLGGSDFLGQITGQTLAAGAGALGFPGLAPALMKAAPAIAEGAMSLLGATGGTGAEESGSTTTSTTSTTRSKSGDISQTDLIELQILKDRQQQAFGTITNILKSIHDTKMAVINNLR